MLYYAAVFFVIAVLSAVLGFGGIAAGAASIAKTLFVVFLVLFIASAVFGMLRRDRPARRHQSGRRIQFDRSRRAPRG